MTVENVKNSVKEVSFDSQVKKWEKNATSARDESARLLGLAFQTLKDGDTGRLNTLFSALRRLPYQVDAFVKFCLWNAGGGTMVEGVEVFRPELSRLKFDSKEQAFQLKEWKVEKVDGLDKAAWLEHKAKEQNAMREAFRAQVEAVKLFEWWAFATNTAKSPYKFAALISAIKKAGENKDTLAGHDKDLLEAIQALCVDAGLHDKI